MEKTVHTINDRRILGIRDAEVAELEKFLHVACDIFSILRSDTVLSLCMSLISVRLQELDSFSDFDSEVEQRMLVYLGETVRNN